MLYFEKRDIMSQFFDSMENELDQSNAREDPLIKFAKEQLDDGFYDDSYTESIKKDTLELITIFAKQRHSGFCFSPKNVKTYGAMGRKVIK